MNTAASLCSYNWTFSIFFFSIVKRTSRSINNL